MNLLRLQQHQRAVFLVSRGAAAHYATATNVTKQPLVQEMETMKRRIREEKAKVSELKRQVKDLKGALVKAQKTGKKRVRKDPNAPKRPLSAYLVYANEVRDDVAKSVQEEVGKYDVGAIGKKIGAKWHDLSDSEKEPYFEKQRTLKQEYEQEMLAYEQSVKLEETI
uniref:HMG box domain-containing protein n=1 Tax=Percolomonas cosmopolitus TaxID=63605 RepID=A0A7S1KQP5_9EUKA|mmetsp:Transcript_4812/g.18014  ORF Transcript_4812/g.18014 Transcript_4812/m.18014 type:complete len:167 (+) Transcript_4812:163-663(+)|eukprot:CAMPEP_0117450292 /NCGR_PEP_ID=MMETSP0759-20121206/8390_1 /TAXON_ID=63605 /ORGANISM="Percolomonas cosmopolitus, Strain WS" /LENGTH=166 /DNA_ID=CAMNT_0005242803 /DNA_START=133 /DNA_END=633 /DNA_ORIENTATION=-